MRGHSVRFHSACWSSMIYWRSQLTSKRESNILALFSFGWEKKPINSTVFWCLLFQINIHCVALTSRTGGKHEKQKKVELCDKIHAFDVNVSSQIYSVEGIEKEYKSCLSNIEGCGLGRGLKIKSWIIVMAIAYFVAFWHNFAIKNCSNT